MYVYEQMEDSAYVCGCDSTDCCVVYRVCGVGVECEGVSQRTPQDIFDCVSSNAFYVLPPQVIGLGCMFGES